MFTTADGGALSSAAPSAMASYFSMFEECACGHSSAWHAGAWNAWRTGVQVTGMCEHGREGGIATMCGCPGFRRDHRLHAEALPQRRAS